MRKRAGSQLRGARHRGVPEHRVDDYADLLEKWSSIMQSGASDLQDRPRSLRWEAISGFLRAWRRTPLSSGSEEILLRYIKGHGGTRRLQHHWSETTVEPLKELWLAYREELLPVLHADLHDLNTLLEVATEEAFAESPARWPDYASEDFEKLVTNAKGLQDSVGDPSQMLYHAKEMETLLGRIEEKGRVISRKYEARLAASLRDICRVHDPSKLSQEQAECLKGSVTMLVEGWGRITREKLNYVRTRLLDKGLTWLPVTDKAVADVEERRTQEQV